MIECELLVDELDEAEQTVDELDDKLDVLDVIEIDDVDEYDEHLNIWMLDEDEVEDEELLQVVLQINDVLDVHLQNPEYDEDEETEQVLLVIVLQNHLLDEDEVEDDIDIYNDEIDEIDEHNVYRYDDIIVLV